MSFSLDNLIQPKRFGRIVLNDFLANTRGLAIAAGATIGMLLVLNVASVASWDRWSFHSVFFPLMLLIGGMVLTSLAFREMHNHERGYMYLTLPGSHLEKFTAKLILTTVGWSLGSLIVYWLFSVLAAGLTSLLFGMAHPIFDPFQESVWQFIRVYVVTQSVFLFGAVRFRRWQLLQTILALSVVGVAFSILTGLLGRLVFHDYFRGPFWTIQWDNSMGEEVMRFYGQVLRVLRFTFWWIMPVFFWAVGFMRLRDTEV